MLRTLAMALFCLGVAGTAVRAEPPGKTAEIAISAFAFVPSTLSVKRGTTVVWVNHDETPHNVVATAGQFKSPALNSNDAFRWTFDKPGNYAYFCRLHPHMTGKVEVTP